MASPKDSICYITLHYITYSIFIEGSIIYANSHLCSCYIYGCHHDGNLPLDGFLKYVFHIMFTFDETTRIHFQNGIKTIDTKQTSPPKVQTEAQDSSRKGKPSGGDSYVKLYLDQKNKNPEYKEYTINDYRTLKKEMKLGLNLGRLGPDLESDELKQRVSCLVDFFFQMKLQDKLTSLGRHTDWVMHCLWNVFKCL